jgi:hypothetical protein
MVAAEFCTPDRNGDVTIVRPDDYLYGAISRKRPEINSARAEKRLASREQLYAANYESCHREPALWTVFGQESKRHPSARGDAASLRCSPPGLVGGSLYTRDNNCDHGYRLAERPRRVQGEVDKSPSDLMASVSPAGTGFHAARLGSRGNGAPLFTLLCHLRLDRGKNHLWKQGDRMVHI